MAAAQKCRRYNNILKKLKSTSNYPELPLGAFQQLSLAQLPYKLHAKLFQKEAHWGYFFCIYLVYEV